MSVFLWCMGIALSQGQRFVQDQVPFGSQTTFLRSSPKVGLARRSTAIFARLQKFRAGSSWCSRAQCQGVSDEIRKRVDDTLGLWRGTPEADRPKIVGQLSQDLVDLGRETVPYLSFLLTHRKPDSPVRSLSIALGRLGDKRAIPALARLLDSSKVEDRHSGVSGLALLETPATRSHLLRALDDSVAEVWMTASEGLISQFKKEEDSAIVDALRTRMSKAKVKTPYALTLGRTATREAHDALRDLLEEDPVEGKLAAFQGLLQFADPEDGSRALRQLYHPPVEVQKEACLFLGKLKHRPAISHLIYLLGSDDPGLKANTHWALKEITGQTMPADAALWEKWWESAAKKEK